MSHHYQKKLNYVTILKFHISEQVSQSSIVSETSNLFLAFMWTLEHCCKDIGLCGTSYVTSHILCYQFIPHRYPQHYNLRLEQHFFIKTQIIQSLLRHYNLVRPYFDFVSYFRILYLFMFISARQVKFRYAVITVQLKVWHVILTQPCNCCQQKIQSAVLNIAKVFIQIFD